MRSALIVCALLGLLAGGPLGVHSWFGGDGGDASEHVHDHDHEHQHSEEDLRDPARRFVSCGSVVKLKHVPTAARLHSHEVSYGSGSRQQSVTGFKGRADVNSMWLILPAHGQECRSGDALQHGSIVRLQHLGTGKLLHSHLHKSPITQQQEVSCFAAPGQGDTGDNWRVELVDASQTTSWQRGAKVRLVHVDTGLFLASNEHTFSNPIPGQHEVCCARGRQTNAEWTAEEGMYIMRTDDGTEDEKAAAAEAEE